MPRRIITAAQHRLGRRGTILALLGAMWIATGITTLLAPPAPAYLLLTVATEARAAAWIVTGAVAMAHAVRPSGHDAAGWVALYVMAAYRAIAYGWGLVTFLLLPDPGGSLRALFGALTWAAILVILIVCAGWREDTGDDTGTIPEVRA